jgi:putative RNA 2'-phosphotransferase
MPAAHTSLSKFLSLVLRHRPEAIGLTLAHDGWVPVAELLTALAAHGRPLDVAALEALVESSDKQRFAFSPDRLLIRANQGHSVRVELGLSPVQPPAILFHGTVARFLPAIRAQGLIKGQRHHVHLSATRELALVVGGRRGAPLVLEIAAAEMAAASYLFYRSENGVWLTNHVPPEFLVVPATAD